jgi:hypothetical protein
LPEPYQDLSDRPQFDELAKHQCDGFLHSPVGILFDVVTAALHVTHGDGQKELAPARLLLHRLDRALAEDGQLHLAHRALHAEQEPVIGRRRIVDTVFIDDDRPDQAAELQKRMPIATVASQP